MVNQIPKQPGDNFELFETFWIERGDTEPEIQQHYILTHTIKRQLNNIARIITAKQFPILLQVPFTCLSGVTDIDITRDPRQVARRV